SRNECSACGHRERPAFRQAPAVAERQTELCRGDSEMKRGPDGEPAVGEVRACLKTLTGTLKRRNTVCMQTLTITDAKKNLGRLLQAAAQGKDIGIVSGGDIIALRKVEVESTDYSQREYGVSDKQLESFGRKAERRYHK